MAIRNRIHFDDDCAAVEEVCCVLQERHIKREVFPQKEITYVVVTKLQRKPDGWEFCSTVTRNGSPADTISFPAGRGSLRIEVSEDKPPKTLVRQAAQAHLEQCQQVQKQLQNITPPIEIIPLNGLKRGGFIVLCACVLIGGWWYIQKRFFPSDNQPIIPIDPQVLVTPFLTPSFPTPTAIPVGPIPNSQIRITFTYQYTPRCQEYFRPLTVGSTLHSGDCYKVIFTAHQDAFLYIFQRDSAGNIQRLFPAKSFQGKLLNHSNPVRKSLQYYLPMQDMSFTLDDQSGQETIYVLAFEERLEALENEVLSDELVYHYVEKTTGVCEYCVDTLIFEHQ
jgi:hypothetical protein